MKFWFKKAEDGKGPAYAGVEQGGFSGFAALDGGGRELLHTASLLVAGLAMRSLTKRTRQTRREAARRAMPVKTKRKNPGRGTGMSPKGFGGGRRGRR